MHSYTVDNVMDLGLCEEYPRTRVAELWDGRESLTAREIAELAIPPKDRVWALCGLATPRTARLFSCRCAERALQRVVDDGGSTDPRSWSAIAIARLYADGDRTDEDLESARSAARSATWVAAWPAAQAAAQSTTLAAAEDAARATANAAAESAAYCGATDAAAERARQIHHLVEMMEADDA